MFDKCIVVWPFYDAPKNLQELSTNGGDEDWIAIVPPNLTGRYIGWLEQGHSFGCCCVDEFPHPELEGVIVKIGSHA